MRAQSCNTDFVPYRKDFCISINSSYPSLVVGLRRRDWAFEGDPKRDNERLGTQGRR